MFYTKPNHQSHFSPTVKSEVEIYAEAKSKNAASLLCIVNVALKRQSVIPFTIFFLLLASILGGCSNNHSSTPAPATETTYTKKQSSESIKAELALYQKAVLTLNEHKLDDAEKLFDQMRKLQPDMAGAWANLALIKMKKGDFKASQKLIVIALEKNSNMPQALNLAGSLALKDGRLNDAKNYFSQAVKEKPDYALAHYNLALLFDIYFQDLPQAITHYQLYLEHLGQEDKDTARWLKGLKSTVGVN